MIPSLPCRAFEKLTPRQIERAWGEAPIAYIPIGTYEWHGHHLPVGLDALKAYALCTLAAERTGGLVLPAFYYGTGGGHKAFPYSVIVDEDTILTILRATLARLHSSGARVAVIFTGHFPHQQLDMIKTLERRDTVEGLHVLALSDCYVPDPPHPPDHAAMFETSMMLGLHPELVHLHELPNVQDAPADVENGDPWGEHRFNENDPLYGICGKDPRLAEPYGARELVDKTVSWLADEVSNCIEEARKNVDA